MIMRDGQIRRFEDLVPVQGGLVNGRGPSRFTVFGEMPVPAKPVTRILKAISLVSTRIFQPTLATMKSLGMQYEQRFDRGYFIGPAGLWTIMRGLTNFHIEQLDKNNPQAVYLNGYFMDTVNYFRLYDGASQRAFDRNLRRELGLPTNGLDYLLDRLLRF
jgi:hypothetical protein